MILKYDKIVAISKEKSKKKVQVVKKNLQNLSGYAKKLRVYKKVTEIMEVLLNG